MVIVQKILNLAVMNKTNFQKLQFHLIYWIVFILFFTLIWGTYDHNYSRNFMIQLCSLPSRLILVYGTLSFLIPNYFLKEHYGKFVLYFTLLLLITSIGIQRAIMIYFVEDIYLTDHKSEHYFTLTQLMNTVLDVNIAAIVPLGYAFFQIWNQSKQHNAELERKNHELNEEQREKFVHLKEGSQLHKVDFKSILFIESLKNYIRVKTINKEIITYKSISSMHELLPEKQFLRVHRSFIISLHHIDSFSPTQINLKGIIIPIGRKYKEEVKERLGYY